MRGSLQGAGQPVLAPNVGGVRSGIGVGSLTSAVPQLRPRKIDPLYLEGPAEVEPPVDAEVVNRFANTVANTMVNIVAKDNTYAADQSYLTYRDEARKTQMAFLLTEHDAAVTAYPQYQQQILALQDKYLSDLNPGARAEAIGQFARDKERLFDLGANHVVAQRKKRDDFQQQNKVMDSLVDLGSYKNDLVGGWKHLGERVGSLFDITTAEGALKGAAYMDSSIKGLVAASLADTKQGQAAVLAGQLRAIQPLLPIAVSNDIQTMLVRAHENERTQFNQFETQQKKYNKEQSNILLTSMNDAKARGEPLSVLQLEQAELFAQMGAMAPGTYGTMIKYSHEFGGGTFSPIEYQKYSFLINNGEMTEEILTQAYVRVGDKEKGIALINQQRAYQRAEKKAGKTITKQYVKNMYLAVTKLPVPTDSETFYADIFEAGGMDAKKAELIRLANDMKLDFYNSLAEQDKLDPQKILDELYIRYQIKGTPAYDRYKAGMDRVADEISESRFIQVEQRLLSTKSLRAVNLKNRGITLREEERIDNTDVRRMEGLIGAEEAYIQKYGRALIRGEK